MSIVAVERREVAIPEEVSVTVEDATVTVEGPEGTNSRRLYHPQISITTEDDQLVVEADLVRRKVAALVGTYAGHLENMVEGVAEGFTARLKIVSSHFPMKANVEGDEVVIGNFLGEKAPRRASILGETDVEIQGEDVTVTGPNKEHVGQTAVNIESATGIQGYDPRVFQDGIYITEKPGDHHG